MPIISSALNPKMCCFRVPLLHSARSIWPYRHAEPFAEEQLHLCSSLCINKIKVQKAQRSFCKRNLNIYMHLQSLRLEFCPLSPRFPCSHPNPSVMSHAESPQMREEIQFICSNSLVQDQSTSPPLPIFELHL